MKLSAPFLLVLFFISCNQPAQNHDRNHPSSTPSTSSIKQQEVVEPPLPDSAEQQVYDFMKIVIAEQNLQLTNGIEIEPESGCDLSSDDSVYLGTLVFEHKKVEKPKQIALVKNDTVKCDTCKPVFKWEFKPENLSVSTVTSGLKKCLTRADVKYMLQQKKHFTNFKWNNSKLGFDIQNTKNRYSFSVPLFSADKKKAIMMIENLCPGLCGTGYTVLFRQVKGKWISEKGPWWIH